MSLPFVVFFWGNGQLFKRSILVSLFVIDFRRVLKHFLNLNTDGSVSTVLINYESILYFNHRYGFDHPVFEKVCFNWIKLSLFCFIYFFFLLLIFIYFRFFVSFVFTGVRTIPPKVLGLGLKLWGKLSQSRFYRWKKRRFFICQRNVRFYLFVICAKLHLLVDTKLTKWSKLDDVIIFQT